MVRLRKYLCLVFLPKFKTVTVKKMKYNSAAKPKSVFSGGISEIWKQDLIQKTRGEHSFIEMEDYRGAPDWWRISGRFLGEMAGQSGPSPLGLGSRQQQQLFSGQSTKCGHWAREDHETINSHRSPMGWRALRHRQHATKLPHIGCVPAFSTVSRSRLPGTEPAKPQEGTKASSQPAPTNLQKNTLNKGTNPVPFDWRTCNSKNYLGI